MVIKMTKRDKTTVDDIIGLVHTEEMTDSVEEVCKLRGRTNERFKLVDDYLIEYDGDYFDLHTPSDIRSLVTVIKYVTDENEQLKDRIDFYNISLKKLQDLTERKINENEQLKKDCTVLIYHNQEYRKENEQLKQQCKELRNDLIDHSALINMLEKVKALNIEDMIWNTMGYKTQTEFDDDFADYREYAKKRWKE